MIREKRHEGGRDPELQSEDEPQKFESIGDGTNKPSHKKELELEERDC